ncbi:MAG: hypothetical protein K6A80_09350 [Saccharofermentans sp.]|nr:hypothetical protein [Saccharofermentans sp.]
MAFMAMFMVMIFFAVVAIGLINLIIGIVLDIIWGVRKKKEKKVYPAHKVFAVIFTVIGVVLGICPVAFVGIASGIEKYKEYAEIKDFTDEERVYSTDFPDVSEAFDFRGDHYVRVYDIHPQPSHDNFKETPVGAIIYDNNHGTDDHSLIYSVENVMGIMILDLEYTSDLFIKESEVDRFVEYYTNEVPLYCQVTNYKDSSSETVIQDVDSARVRELRDRIENNGGQAYDYDYDREIGYLIFYAVDDIGYIDFSCFDTDRGLMVAYLGKQCIVEGEDEAFIRSFFDNKGV